MSRRNQSRRRRTYGRRQHEVRERRPGSTSPANWLDGASDVGWSGGDEGPDQGGNEQDPYGSYER